MERSQRQLRTRLADRLCGDDADHFALLHHARRGQVAAVALRADAVTRLAGKHRTDLDRLQRRLLDRLGDVLGDLLTRLADHLARERVDHVVERRAAQNAVVERLHHVVVALDGRSRQTAQRAAILLVDDDVLRHVDQTARQITGVGRFQRRIGQTLTGTVRRDEVFEHRQTLLEVREDRVLDDLLTAFDTRFLRLGHQTAHTRQLADLLLRTSGAGVEHHVDRVETVLILHQRVDHHLREFGVDVRPDVDDLVVTLVVGDQTHVVVLHDRVRTVVTLLHELLLLLGDNHRVEIERQTALESHAVTHVLDVVEERGHLVGAGLLHHHGDDVAQRLLRKHRIDVAHLLGNDLVEEDAADGRIFQDAHPLTVLVDVVHHALHLGVQVGAFLVVGDDRLLGAVEDQPLALDALARLGDVVESQNHVLRRDGDRRTVGGVQHVVRTQHQQLRFQNGGVAQRQVDGHLVAVEVGVEGRTGQRMQLHGLALDELGLEGLDTQTVQRRGTVHQHRMPLDDVFQNTPDDGILAVDDLLGRLYGFDDTALDELADDERLVQLGRHILRDTHFVHFQLGADDDDRTRRVVDTLTQQVLAETALLAFERIRQRFERTVRLVLHGVALARVVEQRVDGLLQHALLVAQNHLRRLDLDQAFEAVVADDDAAVEVVQIRRGETAAVERNERAQLGRDDGDHLQHHPLGFVQPVRSAERLDDVQALQRLALTLLRGLGRSLVTQGVGHRIEVDLLQERVDRLGTHLGDELVGVRIVERLVALRQRGQHVEVLLLGERLQTLDALLGRSAGVDDHVTFVVDDRFEFLRRDTQQVADLRRKRTEIPDMHHRNDQRDMAHALAAHLLLGHLHAAAVADDTLVADTLVLAAVALVVLHRAEDTLAEQTVAFGLVRSVVDRFRFEHLAARLGENLLGRCQSDRNAIVAASRFVIFVEWHNDSVFLSRFTTLYSSLTESARPRSSCSRTFIASGMPGLGRLSPLTIAS